MLGRWIGWQSEASFVRSVATGELSIEHLTSPDWLRIEKLLETYSDLSLGTVDASIIAVAERLKVKTVLTLDERHFLTVKPLHRKFFELIPKPE